jgi:hypothetical protein
MVRLIIAIATVSVIVIAGLMIFIISWGGESSPISQDEEFLPSLPVIVSINAIPWAKVFIKLPESDGFIEPRAQDFTIQPGPNQKKSNVTPIRGGLKAPIGTTIKLVYAAEEKSFPYEVWKDEKTISYDFLNQ